MKIITKLFIFTSLFGIKHVNGQQHTTLPEISADGPLVVSDGPGSPEAIPISTFPTTRSSTGQADSSYTSGGQAYLGFGSASAVNYATAPIPMQGTIFAAQDSYFTPPPAPVYTADSTEGFASPATMNFAPDPSMAASLQGKAFGGVDATGKFHYDPITRNATMIGQFNPQTSPNSPSSRLGSSTGISSVPAEALSTFEGTAIDRDNVQVTHSSAAIAVGAVNQSNVAAMNSQINDQLQAVVTAPLTSETLAFTEPDKEIIDKNNDGAIPYTEIEYPSRLGLGTDIGSFGDFTPDGTYVYSPYGPQKLLYSTITIANFVVTPGVEDFRDLRSGYGRVDSSTDMFTTFGNVRIDTSNFRASENVIDMRGVAVTEEMIMKIVEEKAAVKAEREALATREFWDNGGKPIRVTEEYLMNFVGEALSGKKSTDGKNSALDTTKDFFAFPPAGPHSSIWTFATLLVRARDAAALVINDNWLTAMIPGAEPQKKNVASGTGRVAVAKSLAQLMIYLRLVPKSRVPAASASLIKAKAVDWFKRPTVNPFAEDVVFKRTMESLAPVRVATRAKTYTFGQLLSCLSDPQTLASAGVLRFFNPNTGEHRLVQSMSEGCSAKLQFEGRAFVNFPIGTPGTVPLNICTRNGKQNFPSVDATCLGGKKLGTLGAVFSAARPGLVPLLSAKNNTNDFHLITANGQEFTFNTAYKKPKVIGFVIPTTLSPLLSLPRGRSKVGTQDGILHSNGNGIYCAYGNYESFLELGGKKYLSDVLSVPSIPPGMKFTGGCIPPKTQEGVFSALSGPGVEINYPKMTSATNFTDKARLYYTNGGNLVCSFSSFADFRQFSKLNPAEFSDQYFQGLPAKSGIAINANRFKNMPGGELIYAGQCRRRQKI